MSKLSEEPQAASVAAQSARPASQDPDADLFRMLYPSLRRFAATCAPPSLEPDDLVQQAVANALAIQPLCELDHPAAYLRVTIANLARNQHRKDRNAPRLSEAGIETDAYPSDLAVLGSLSPDDRLALYLVEIERQSYREAADAIGCSEVALRARVMRARRRLQRAVDERASEL
jgi:RNA polymerase sigma-70 factor (ECF subfamily)